LEAPTGSEGTRIWRNEILDKTLGNVDAETDIPVVGNMDKEQGKKT
jgi:hypothetical protein